MTARIIDGKVIAAELRARVAEEVARIKREHQLTPGLAVVLVGNDPGSELPQAGQGVWGRKVSLAHVLQDQDRLEVYRALTVDPKVARRERFVRARDVDR